METKHEQSAQEKETKSAHDLWGEIMSLTEEDDVSQVEYLLLHRADFGLGETKLPGEDEIFAWLDGRAENKLGRKLLVKLNEKGIIVPIASEDNKSSEK